jgi:hypothetical protein
VDSHLEAVALAKFDARRDSEYSLAWNSQLVER